ncbi:MAG: glycosyltransferase, partial [Betaproteobacteria bacterium]
MKIAYLLNSYPMTSTTFIRREIERLEAAGVEVLRFACRHWNGGALVDPLDIADQRRTEYMLTGNASGVLREFAEELLANPGGVLRAAAATLRLWRNARAGLGRHLGDLAQAAYFKRRARAEGVEHVHAHFATNAAAIAMLSQLMGGPHYSFTVHGPDEFDNTDRLSFDLKMRHARFIAAISHFCRVQLVRATSWAHWDKIAIVHCGLAIADFEPHHEFDEANQTFVNIARFNAQKGLLLIPPTLALLKAEFPALRVVLIGDGEERPALEAAIRQHDVADMIELRGWQVNATVREVLRTSRGLLLPSFAEGLPVVIMEAFALGRPVVTTYIAGIPELVDERCGWLVPAGSVDALAEALRAALRASPAALAEMGREGRRHAVEQHDVTVE